jgi:phosphatidylglycerophosphate synthase
MAILSVANCKKLAQYQYKGTCNSPVYNHGLTHIANYFITLTPTWIAPNTITVSGMLPMSFCLLLALWYDPWMQGNPISWYPLALAAAIFTYQTADNMDGKQARKVGASSGLGMLFDHVCDAINSGMFATWHYCAVVMGSELCYRFLYRTILFTELCRDIGDVHGLSIWMWVDYGVLGHCGVCLLSVLCADVGRILLEGN